jgi:hypothetical protein
MSEDILKVMESIREEDRIEEACKKEAQKATQVTSVTGTGSQADPYVMSPSHFIRVTKADDITSHNAAPMPAVPLTPSPRVKADMPDLDGEAEESDATESEYEGTIDDLMKGVGNTVAANSPIPTPAPAPTRGRVVPDNPFDNMDTTRPPKDIMVGHNY